MNKTLSKCWNDFYKNMIYDESYFRDHDQVASWKAAGHAIESTTIHINQSFSIKDFPELEKQFSEIHHIEMGLHKILPGHYLPMHRDQYSFYKKKHNIENLNNIVRYVVFLEDAKPGHYLVVDTKVYSDWKAGDAIGWVGDTAHSAINLGFENRYTIQLTGIHDS